MKVTADTNLLLRLVVGDNPAQQLLAKNVFENASVVAVGVVALCELVWVLDRRYRVAPPDIAATIRLLTSRHNVVTNRPAVEAGLGLLDAGGDFADGAIAYEGRWLGGDTFVSFDRKAVQLLTARGQAATRLD